MNISRKLAKFFLIVLVAVGVARAQVPVGTIVGSVTDPPGNPVAGTQVRLINRDSGLVRNLTTTKEGFYTASALPPGVYLVTAEAEGFSLAQRSVTVETGTTTTVNLRLKSAKCVSK